MGKLQRKTTQQENRKEEENRKGENCKGENRKGTDTCSGETEKKKLSNQVVAGLAPPLHKTIK